MRILFCKTGYMKYYKGINENDKLYNGGEYVAETGDGGEIFNFDAVTFEDEEQCFGFVETKHKDGWKTQNAQNNQLHIEKIDSFAKNDESINNVLVVWCAVKPNIGLRVIGWYKDATVYRYYNSLEFENGFVQNYNILAKKKNCVLLPHNEVNRYIWQAPSAKKQGYGFGQSLVWYPDENKIQPLVTQILNYSEKNYIDMYHEIDPYKVETIKI